MGHRGPTYTFHDANGTAANRLLLLNTESFFSGTRNKITVDIASLVASSNASTVIYGKRLTTPYIDTKDTTKVTWAGQHYANGTAAGQLNFERVSGTTVTVRASEALLLWLQGSQPFDLAANATTPVGTGVGAAVTSPNSVIRISSSFLFATLTSCVILLALLR